ncbi:hypothetical protein WKT22_03128 [Candidatus Lokiarchaeum ossiferum]
MFPTKNVSNPTKDASNRSESPLLVKFTNFVTNFIFFLFFLVGVPFLLGWAISTVTTSLISNPALFDEIRLGVWLLFSAIMVPVGYIFFLKSRKLPIFHKITISAQEKPLFQSLGLLILPELIVVSSFYVLNGVLGYSTFLREFQFAIIPIFSVASLLLLSTYSILIDPTHLHLETINRGDQQGYVVAFHQKSMAKIFQDTLILKMILILGALFLDMHVVLVIIVDGFLLILLSVFSALSSKISPEKQDFRFALKIIIYKTGLLVAGLLIFAISLNSSEFNQILFILTTILLIFKVGLTLFMGQIRNLNYNEAMWQRSKKINDILTFILYLCSIPLIFLRFGELGGIFAFITVLLFVPLIFIENHYEITNKEFARIFYMANLLICDAILSFFVIPTSLFGYSVMVNIIIFTLLLTVFSSVLDYQKLISNKAYVILQNILLTTLFFEIAIQLAMFNFLPISNSVVFNYIWFLSIGFLSSFYRLYVVQFKKQTNRYLSVIIIGCFYIIFSGIFLLLTKNLVGINDRLISPIQEGTGLPIIFRPSGFISFIENSLENFFSWIGTLNANFSAMIPSSNGLISLWNLFLCLGLTLGMLFFVLNIHKQLKILNSNIYLKNTLILQLFGNVMLFFGTLLVFQSFFGLFLAISIAILGVSRIIRKMFQLKWKIDDQAKYDQITKKLILFNLGLSLFCFLFFSWEIMQLNVFLSLVIAMFVLKVYVNLVPIVKNALNHVVNGKMTLHLINGVITCLISGLLIPSVILNLESIFAIQPSIHLGILASSSILILTLFYRLALPQFLKGNYLTQLQYSKMIFLNSIVFLGSVYAVVEIIGLHYISWINLQHQSLSINLWVIFIPLYAIWFISNRQKTSSLRKDDEFVKLGWQIATLVLWIISTSGFAFSLMYSFAFSLFFVSLGVIILGTCTITTLNYLTQLKPALEPKLSELKTRISYITILLIILAVFSASYKTPDDGLSASLSLVFALLSAIILFNSVPLLRKSLSTKALFILNASFLVSLSIVIDTSILIPLNEIQSISLSVFSASFLIPLVMIQYSIYLLGKSVIAHELARKIHQIVAFIGLITIASIPFESILNSSGGVFLALFVSSLIITALLVVDMVTFKWITTDRLILLVFLIAFATNATSLGLFVSNNLDLNFDYKIVIFILFMLPCVFSLLKFVDWGNNKLLQKRSQATPVQNVSTQSIQTKSQSEVPYPPSNTAVNIHNVPNVPSMQQPIISAPIQYSGDLPLTHNLHQQILSHYDSIVPIFDILCLLISFYLGLRMIFSDALSFPLAILIMGTSILSAFTIFDNKIKMTSFVIEYFQALISIALYFLFTIDVEGSFIINNLPNVSENVIFWLIFALQLLFIGFSAFISTHHTPLNKIVKNSQSLFLLALIGYPFIGTPFIAEKIPITLALTFIALIFTISIDFRFKNLLFRSILPWSLATLVGHLLWNYSDRPLHLDILIPITVGMVLQWVLLQYYYLGNSKISKFKSIIGYSAILLSLTTYITLYLEFKFVMGLLSPVVFSLLIITLLQLKKIPSLSHRISIYNQIIILSTFVVFFFAGAHYFFFTFEYKWYLAISLANTASGFVNLKLFDKLNVQASKFLIGNLGLSTISSGLLFGLFLNDPTLIDMKLKFVVPIAIDLAVLMFFLAIRAYQGSFKQVWDYGWYIWNIMPIVNLFLIFPLVSGLDQLSSGIPFTNDLSLNGSIILTLILVSFLELPVFISKLKKNFNRIIYGFWFEFVALSIWGAENLFPELLTVKFAFIGLAAFLLLVPIFTYYKQWNYLTILWPFLAAANILFFSFLFDLDPNWMIPVDSLVGGLYVLVWGYFPNIKEKFPKTRLSLVLIGYFSMYVSIFALVFNFVQLVGVPSNIALSLTFIIMSFGLLSGKWVDLSEKGLKVILSITSVVNMGIITAQSMALIPGYDLQLFGIFLGISFSFGSLFIFQSRNFLPPIFKEVIWFGMALSMGLAIASLLLFLWHAGIWAVIGVLILVTCLICLPLSFFRQNLFIINSFMVLSISLLIMQPLVHISAFVEWYQPLVFIDIFLGLELAYLWISAKKPRYSLFQNLKKNLEIFVILWMVFSTLISFTFIRFVMDWMHFDFDLIIVFGTILGFSLLALLGMKPIRDYALFNQFSVIDKIITHLQTSLSIISYGSAAILIGIILPSTSTANPILFNICYRLAVISLVLLVEFSVLDSYQLKLIPPELRSQLTWIFFFIFTLCGFGLVQLGVEYWTLSLFLLCLFTFATIRLIVNANTKINPKNLNLGNALVLIGTLFSVLWGVLKIEEHVIDKNFHTLSLNLLIASLLVYGFAKIKIIPAKILQFIPYLISFFMAILLEELSRVYLPLSPLFHICVFILFFSILNLKRITHSFLVYFFWLGLALSLSGFIMEPISILGGDSLSLYSKVMMFLFGLSTLFSFFTHRIASIIHHQTPNSHYTLDVAKPAFKPMKINYGYHNIKTNQKIYVGSTIFSGLITTIGGTSLWASLISSKLTSSELITSLQQSFLLISLPPLILSIFAASIFNYIRANELWFDHENVKNRLIKWQKISGVLIYLFIPIFITSNLHFLLLPVLENLWWRLAIDCFAIFGLTFICVSLFDRKFVHYLDDQLSLKISVVALVGIGISLFGFWYLATGNIMGGLIIFSLFSFSLKPYVRIYDKIYLKFIFGLNLSLYLWILIQIGVLLYSIPSFWILATIFLLVCIHIAIEIESHFTFLRPFTQWIQALRLISWVVTSVGTTALMVVQQISQFSLGYLFLDMIILTVEGFYLNYLLYHQKDADKYFKNNQTLGLIVYGEIIGLITSFLIPIILAINTDSKILDLLESFALASVICFAIYGLIYLDDKIIHLIQPQSRKILRLGTYLLFIGIFALDCSLLVMFIFDLSPIGGSLPFNQQIVLSSTIGSGILALAFLYRFHNKKINQIFYWIVSIQISILCYISDSPILLFVVASLSFVMYFFIFFMEAILKALRIIIEKISLFFKNIWGYIRQFLTWILQTLVGFYRKFKKAIYLSSALVLSGFLFYILGGTNFELIPRISSSILAFLLVIIPISPEVQKKTTEKTFLAKIFYRFGILFSALGISNQFAPDFPWWNPFIIFIFFAAFIWGVKISEDEYKLSIYWRFSAVILTIIDLIYLVYVFVFGS